MKTVDINLIGDLGKATVKPQKKVKFEGDIGSQAKKTSMILVGGACMIFALSFAAWLLMFYFNHKFNTELTQLKEKNQESIAELKTLNSIKKSLEEDKKVLELKLIAKKQVESQFLPWHSVLSDISGVVPKDIKITGISKFFEVSGDKQKANIEIRGQINSNQNNSLKLISFLVINISENLPQASYLNNATIKGIKYNDETNIYDFTIKAGIKAKSGIQELTESKLTNTKAKQVTPVNKPAPANVKKLSIGNQNENYAVLSTLLVKNK